MKQWRDILEQTAGIAMVLDRDLRIVDIGWQNWILFWRQNGGGQIPDMIGRDVTAFFSEGPVRDTFRHALNEVLLSERPWMRLDFRCDSPDLSRMMRLTVTPLTEDGAIKALLYQSEPIWSSPRDTPLPVFPPVEQVCAVCSRITPTAPDTASRDFAWWDWTPPSPSAPKPVQTLCPQCHLDLLSTRDYA